MATTETSPLLPQYQRPAANPATTSPRSDRRTVTFNPLTTISTYNGTSQSDSIVQPLQASSPPVRHTSLGPVGQPMLSALNSKLRRRNSAGSPVTAAAGTIVAPKIGPQRTSKNTQKLKLLPDPVTGDDEEVIDDGFPRDVYTQISRIKEPTARRAAARLGKADRDRLPRVTAYCTANSYRLDGVMRFLKSRDKTRGANPKLFDECVYSPFDYQYEKKQAEHQTQTRNGLHPEGYSQPQPQQHRLPGERRYSDSAVEVEEHGKNIREDLIDFRDEETTRSQSTSSINKAVTQDEEGLDLDTTVHTPEVFLFDYGTVVIWGMTPAEETRFLADVAKFATAILSTEDRQVENFNFYYARDYQARIYNDFISLRDPRNHMIKLAISHALSQSVKTSLFEDLVSETIAATAPFPAQIAKTGSVNMTRKQINMQIGELFILRINIHLQGSVLDSPELMWAEPQLEPVYQAVRTYLEMDQRVGLLTERLDVIADLLAVLKDQLSHRHGEYLEWIVIVLIAAEILVAAINIIVDLYAGVE
ncbi:Sporulation protein RMD1 [Talaromyces pinophilus]|nr:Sporulation protein RMD1 [Talaromyces pinophilus]